MEPITLRVPEELGEELSEEAEEHGFRSRSEYVRRILRNRSEYDAYSDRTQSDYVSREEFEELRERVAAIETETGGTREAGGGAVAFSERDPGGSAGEDLPAEMVSWARTREPVSRAEIMAWVEPQIDIKPDSWWKRHGRDALKAAGAEFTRNRGWEFE